MFSRSNILWFILIAGAGIFVLLYLFNTLFPAVVSSQALKYFSAHQIESGRSYSEAARLAYILSFLAQGVFLVWFVAGGKAVTLANWTDRWNRLYSMVLFTTVLWVLLQVINLPFSFYSSFTLQHQWGYSTQGLGGWCWDYFKGAGLDYLLTGLGALVFFYLTHRWSKQWWIFGAGVFSAWLVIQTFLWPVLIAPLFNKFVPAEDQTVVTMVRDIARRSGVPVGQVLIMDASQRTTKANAYFAGLGRTKQIVLYDNLLRDYSPDEVKAVVAHEIAHWRQGHIVKGLLLGIIGSFVGWALIFLLLKDIFPRYRPWPVYAWAQVLLAFSLISFWSNPIQNYYSRQMEAEADAVSVMLTNDVGAAVQLQIDLAAKSSADVQPPSFIEWFSYSHPSTLERISNLEQIRGMEK